MNKKVKIEKEIHFSSMIGDITAIQLEKNINVLNKDEIEGKLILSGKYKSTTASQIEEDFSYDIPIEITITEKIEPETLKIDITDFDYEISNPDSLKCNIELSIEGVEILEEDRECDGDPIEAKEIEIPHIETPIEEDRKEEIEERKEEEDKNLFHIEEKETYGTFIVYIVRQNETINTIIEKYHTSLEELEKYNDIKNIMQGTKIIIPYNNEKNS